MSSLQSPFIGEIAQYHFQVKLSKKRLSQRKITQTDTKTASLRSSGWTKVLAQHMSHLSCSQSASQPRSIAVTPFLSFSALCPFMADVISPLHQGDCWPTRDWHRLLANIRDQQTQRWPDPVIRSHCFPFSPFYISAIFKSHYCFFLHFAINFHFTFLHFCSHK